ncbi:MULTISPECIES: response regulator [Streptomyces]|uniref:response regulator n=1 Tax=Streptomyces sp. SYP-A7185 TaxID=3040076 RepID=UPI0038F6E43F
MASKSVILVVDDHRDTLFALESALAPLGYPLVSVTNGDHALRVVLRGEVGLILLDVRMPGVSGLDVVRYVRRLDQTRAIPIILLTGFDVSREIAAAAFLLGVADVALKPIDPLTLRTKVRYLFDTYEQLKSMRREIQDLRSQLEAGSTKPTNDSHSAPRWTSDPQIES